MRRSAESRGLLSWLLAILVVWGCASVSPGSREEEAEKKEDRIGSAYFRHRWWNYYDRALAYAEIRSYEKAVADLEEALRQREGDQRMARTYGMHFIDYFPRRELGVVLYQMGDYGKAETELEASLAQYPTAKAQFYLERVRKALIEKEGRKITEPRLSLDLDTVPVWTREDPVVVSGEAEDEMYVAGIRINGAPLFIEAAKKQIRFQRDLSLGQGRHLVSVEAVNLLGGKTKQEVVIHVDREGPMVIIEELDVETRKTTSEVTVSGFVHDEAGVSVLEVDGQAISIEEGADVPFTYRRAVEADTVELFARDRLGNSTTARIPLAPAEVGRSPVRLAFSDAGERDGYPLISLFGLGDTTPPEVSLEGWTDSQVVYLGKVYLEGRVSDAGKIASLTVNQIPLLIRKGRMIFFNYFVELEEGENRVLIEVSDEAGNSATRGINITRKVPKALQLSERLSLTVLPMEQGGAVSDASLFFQNYLIDALVDRNRFRVVEREQLAEILEEQKLSQSKLIDQSSAVLLGRLVAVQAIVTGSIIETSAGIEIVSKMIDTETSEILATEDVYDESKDAAALKALAEAMAIKIHRDFPLVDGLVIERKKQQIFTDLGEEKVRRQKRILVYRETVLEHPLTKKPLGTDNEIIGRAVLTQVMPEASKAEIVSGRAEEIQPMDKVITQ
jgi:Curli production assembly/transport component CsgG